MKAEELFQLLRAKRVSVVDTREAPAFGRAHIPGATSMPLEEIEGRLAELMMLGAPPGALLPLGRPHERACRRSSPSRASAPRFSKAGCSPGKPQGSPSSDRIEFQRPIVARPGVERRREHLAHRDVRRVRCALAGVELGLGLRRAVGTLGDLHAG